MSKVRGFTCGAFDLLHAGHALMLKEAKESCDHLIVGVQGDPSIDRPEKNKPVQSYDERITMVKAIRWVDEVVLYNTEEELTDVFNTAIRERSKSISKWKKIDVEEIEPDDKYSVIGYLNKETTSNHLSFDPINSIVPVNDLLKRGKVYANSNY